MAFRYLKISAVGDRIKVVAPKSVSRFFLPGKADAEAAVWAASVAREIARSDDGSVCPADAAAVAEALLTEREVKKALTKGTTAISRARRRIYEAVACNPWDWFVTLTLDADKIARRGYTRDDLAAWRADFAQWLRNRRRLHGGAYAYCLVPETHADGRSWHMHGVLAGLPQNDIGDFPAGAPRDLIEGGYRNWMPFSDVFGYCSLAPIRDQGRCASYIAKYVTKDAARGVTASGGHMYFISRGLAAAQRLDEGYFLLPDGWTWDYGGEFAAVRWLPAAELDQLRALRWQEPEKEHETCTLLP